MIKFKSLNVINNMYPAIFLLVSNYMIFSLFYIFKIFEAYEKLFKLKKESNANDFIIHTIKVLASHTEILFLFVALTLLIIILLESQVKATFIRNAIYKIMLIVAIIFFLFICQQIILYQFELLSEILEIKVIERKI